MPSAHPKRLISAGPVLEAAIAGTIAALDRAGVEVPRQGGKVNVSALARRAFVVTALAPAEALVRARAYDEESLRVPSAPGAKPASTLLVGGPVVEAGILGAVDALRRAGVNVPEWRGDPNVGAVVRIALVVTAFAPGEVLRDAARRIREQERDEALRKLFTHPADQEALARAAKALDRFGVDPGRVGAVIRAALLVAARAPDSALQEATAVAHTLEPDA